MAGLSEFWESLNNKCWPLLDALHLSDFFENKNLPPIISPIAIVVLIILLMMMLSPGGAPAATCGDGICDSTEDQTTCSADCSKTSGNATQRSVVVSLGTTPACSVDVSLMDSANKLLQKQSGKKDTFSFAKVGADKVKVVVASAEGKTQSTPLQDLSKGENKIDIALDSSICTALVSMTGTLRLTVKDADTNSPLSGVSVSIAEMQGDMPVNYAVQNVLLNSQKDFSLPQGKSYTIYAVKSGYVEAQEDIFMSPNQQTVSKGIALEPLGAGADEGDLEVCVVNGTVPLLSGLISIQDTTGDFIQSGEISEADPETEPSGPGCYVFKNIPAGRIILVSMSMPPAGCVPSASSPVTIMPGERADAFLSLTCQSDAVGYLKIKVIGDNNVVLTQNATVTVWTQGGSFIPGTGTAGKLAMGSSGYTEEVTVPANSSLYAWIKGLSSLGYSDYKYQPITVSTGEHKPVSIYLTQTAITTPSINFTFSVTAPDIIAKGQPFTVAISQVKYGGTPLTSTQVTLTATVNGQACSVTYDSVQKWRAACIAPNTTGNYNVVLTASYQGKTGAYSLPISVIDYWSGMKMLTISSVYPTSGVSPLDLYYDIKFNRTQDVTELSAQRITVKYSDSPDAYPGWVTKLALDDATGYWKLTANVPYKGDYKLGIFIETLKGNFFYNASYTVTFDTNSNSPLLRASVSVDPTILSTNSNPAEDFEIEATLSFPGANGVAREAYGLEIFNFDMQQGVLYNIPWDPDRHVYALTVDAPTSEVCNLVLKFLVNEEEVAERQTIHAIAAAPGGSCELSSGGTSCHDITEVRRCVYESKSKTTDFRYYTESQLTRCITSGCPLTSELACPTTNKGDANLDCVLDDQDITWADSVKSYPASTLQGLVECADMDNDGKVEADDFTCLRNIVSKTPGWYGDLEGDPDDNGVCINGTMNGGFCAKIDVTSPLPGDLDGDKYIDQHDLDLMNKTIIPAVFAGVEPTDEMLEVADFNGDNTITYADYVCLKALYGMRLERNNPMPESGAIPAGCVHIFGLTCDATTPVIGNLDDDPIMNERDYVIEWLIVHDWFDDATVTRVRACADINEDDALTVDDLNCLSAYFDYREDNDADGATKWAACRNCEEGMPPAALSTDGLEICNDYWDNNCDNLADDEDPRCACNASSNTPCTMKYDNDSGVSPGVKDGNYKVCRLFPSSGASIEPEYRWVNQDDSRLTCSAITQCSVYYCNENTARACSAFGVWDWKTQVPTGHCEFAQFVQTEYGLIRCFDCGGSDSLVQGYYSGYCPTGQLNFGQTFAWYENGCPADGIDNDCFGGDYQECGGSCFPTGTKVLMENGMPNNIEDIRIGDIVMSYDIESQTYATGEVLKIDAPIRPDIYTMTFANGEILRLTSEHPLYVDGKGWASIDPSATYSESGWVISKLEVGDRVLNSEKEFVTIGDITFGLVQGGVRSYDLTVAGHNNYFADGFLAHNHGGHWHN